MTQLHDDGGTTVEAESLILFGQQLRECAELLSRGSTVQERMALVCLDNLAEVVLWHHARRHFVAGRTSPEWMNVRRFSGAMRTKILGSFTRKVELGQRRFEGTFSHADFDAVLDSEDAAIFRVAHEYRNGVYHEDRHNRTLLHPLCALYWRAVARSWCRLQRDRTWWSNTLPQCLPGLAMLGVDTDRFSVSASPEVGWFNDRGIAEEIVGHLGRDLVVSRAELARVLSVDLIDRAERADDGLTSLIPHDMDEETLDFALFWSALEHENADDPIIVEIETQRAQAWEGLLRESTPPPRPVRDELDALDQRYFDRIEELRADFKPKVGRDTAASVVRRARRLSTAATMDRLLQRYHQIDTELALLEALTERVLVLAEQRFQMEVQRAAEMG